MKKKVIKFLLFAILGIFLLEVGVYVMLHRPRPEEQKQEMVVEQTPVVRVLGVGGTYSESDGLTTKVQLASLKNSIISMNSTREASFIINTYQNQINMVHYEIRSLDGSTLIDEVDLTDFKMAEDGSITIPVKLTDLLRQNTEYALTIRLDLGDKSLYYYNQLVYADDMHTDELLAYVQNFSNATFDKTSNNRTIIDAIKSDASMSNDNLRYVNLHSNFDLLTWGTLVPVRAADPKISITDLNSSQMSVTLSYPVTAAVSGVTRIYNVEESFCVRYRKGSISLLDYERHMNQQFAVDETSVSGSQISLGIGEDNCQIRNPEDKTITAFVQDGQLWLNDSKTNTISRIFSCKEYNSEQPAFHPEQSHIKIINVKDSQDINFVVYGVQQVGTNAGSIGITAYRYHANSNTVEELFYAPLTVSNDILGNEFGNLVYLNDSDIFYFQYGRTLYEYNIGKNELKEIVTLDSADRYFISEEGDYIAWEEDPENGMCHTIQMLKTATGEQVSKIAEDGTYFKLSKFMNTDLVYGIGRDADLVRESGVILLQPLYAVDILNPENQEVENHYEKEGIYISDIQVSDSSVLFKRVQKQSDGVYSEIGDDTLLPNIASDTAAVSKVVSGTTDQRKKEYYLKLPQPGVAVPVIKTALPLLEGKKKVPLLQLNDNFADEDDYYAYGYGREFINTKSMSEAIAFAYENRGFVLSNTHQYLWRRVFLSAAKNLEIPQVAASNESETLNSVVQMVASYENVDAGAQSGDSVFSRLQSILEARVLNLYNCKLENVLYYIDRGSPVIVVMDDNSARIITGYTAKSVIMYDPLQNTNTEFTMQDAEDVFSNQGNKFISYMK